jgi:hypothetical protein
MTYNQEQRFAANAGIAIGPILFVVAILAVLVGAIAAGSGGFGGSTADETARVRAGTIIQQGINIKNGSDRMVVNGSDPTTIVVAETGFTSTSLVALYGTAGGGITIQSPPREAVPTGSTWRFVRNTNIPSVGGTNGDFIAVLQVNQAICVALNDIIFGRGTYTASTLPIMATTAPTVTIAAATTGDTVTPSGNVFPIGTGFTPALGGRISACVSDNAGTPAFYYYQLLSAG